VEETNITREYSNIQLFKTNTTSKEQTKNLSWKKQLQKYKNSSYFTTKYNNQICSLLCNQKRRDPEK
jgi:hypothetical protein